MTPNPDQPTSGSPVRTDARSMRVSERYRSLRDGGADPHEWAYAWRRELNRGGFRAVDFLMDEVVESGKCVGCAACVTICPVDVFDYVDERPQDTRTDACVLCVLCAEVCPVLRPADRDLPVMLERRAPAIDEGFGAYSYGVYARSADPEWVARAQDGGLVSGLVIHGLETGALSGAVLGDVMPEQRQIGRPLLATTREEVLGAAGSRYTYSPNTLALVEAMRRDVKPLAVVGVPCQVDGVRLQQNSSISLSVAQWYRDNISLVIGLLCSEAFTHESISKLGEMIDVEPSRIDNINIKGKVVVRLDDGEIRTASLRKYQDFARPACLYCLDYGAENADISAGGVGLDDWTLTLVRTEAGHRALQAAIDDRWIETQPLETEPRGMFLFDKLAAAKKKNRPLPAMMPTLAEREALGWLNPKTFYTKGPGAPAATEEGES
ncbi:MAG: Coenzyme F420 hydrogenase/dehydrogenase, beta subunit C-terminal domain [Actinomycetia bacterium]|nr:Coenzyme F420 hydrogenase/dehydrogenase, beta subunit C-terminal domain [Actinomycetes bacterium]